MSSHRIADPTPGDYLHANGDVVPFYVCAGVKEAPIGYTVFPHGGDFEGIVCCPAREICAWHAAHDLGGTMEYNAQPKERLLVPAFKTGPFSCPQFEDHQKMLRAQRKKASKDAAAAKKATPPSQGVAVFGSSSSAAS